MTKDINLLPEKDRLSKQEESVISQSRMAGTVFLGAVVFVAAAIFLAEQVMLFQERDIMAKNQTLEGVVSNLKDREILLRLTKSKATGITAILNSRPDFTQVLDNLSSLLPTGVKVNELTIKPGGVVNLNASADSSSSINQFLGALTDPNNGQTKFTSVAVDSLSSDKTGGYNAIITMQAVGQKWK